MLVPYLIGKLSQPVRLQQQRRAETKPSMRNVGGVMVKNKEVGGKKEKCQNGKTEKEKQHKRSRMKRNFCRQTLVWSFKAARKHQMKLEF